MSSYWAEVEEVVTGDDDAFMLLSSAPQSSTPQPSLSWAKEAGGIAGVGGLAVFGFQRRSRTGIRLELES